MREFWSRILISVAADKPIDALFITSGFHQHPADIDPGVVEELIRGLRQLRASGKVRLIYWKMTTTVAPFIDTPYNYSREMEWVKAVLVPEGILIYDSWAVTNGASSDSPFVAAAKSGGLRATWADGMHYLPFVYKGLNQALAAELCAGGGPFEILNGTRMPRR